MAHYLMTMASPQATGAGRMSYLFAASLIERGHGVTMVHGPEPNHLPSIVPEMTSLGAEALLFPGLRMPFPWLSKPLAKIIQDRSGAGVIAFNQLDRAIAVRSAKRAGVPGFVSAQKSHLFNGRWPIRALKQWYYAKTLRECARLVICTSSIVQTEVVERFGVPIDRAPILTNGIDVSLFKPISEEECESLRRELGVSRDELLLLNVGRIDPQKGQDVLVEACKMLNLAQHNAKLVLVGGASESVREGKADAYFQRVTSLIHEYGLTNRIIFAGWRNDVSKLLFAADAYVHSALWEGFPLAALEALAASRPCVLTDCAGRPSGFVDGEHGWIVPLGKAEPLAQSLERLLLRTSAERLAMGAACRQLAVAHYDIRTIGPRFAEMIEAHSLKKMTGPTAPS